MTHSFDGHANCFVESGHGKALLLDFNYETQPLTGHFPFPKVGPMTLLGESRANHLGKLAFRHVYWNALLPGRPIGSARRHVDDRQEPRVAPEGDADTMTTTTIAGHEVDVNEEGFLTQPAQWDEALAPELARAIGLELTDAHWTLIRFLRDDYAAQGETATLRRVSTQTGTPVKELFVLFPGKPAKKMAYVSGLPKPKGCV